MIIFTVFSRSPSVMVSSVIVGDSKSTIYGSVALPVPEEYSTLEEIDITGRTPVSLEGSSLL